VYQVPLETCGPDRVDLMLWEWVWYMKQIIMAHWFKGRHEAVWDAMVARTVV
jgi:hypothetical protein